MWCLIAGALACLMLALVALVAQPFRLRLDRLNPMRLIRGCLALTFLLIALGLVGLALAVARPDLLSRFS